MTSSRDARRPTRRSSSSRMTTSPTARASRSASWSAPRPRTAAATSRPMPRVRDNEKVLQRDRDYSACTLAPTADIYYGELHVDDSFHCGGSSRRLSRAASSSCWHRISGVQATSRSTRRRGTLSGRSTRRTDQYNFGPLNFYQRPDTRYSLGALGHYELAEYADVYTQLMFNDYESTAQIAPGGEFLTEQLFDINCDNPMLCAQQLASIGCDAAPTDPGNHASCRCSSDAATSRAAVARTPSTTPASAVCVGVRGAISENWDYDAERAVLEGEPAGRTLNRFVMERSQRAIDVVHRPGSGERRRFNQPVCRSFLDGTDPNCVPYNIFDLGIRPARPLWPTCRRRPSRRPGSTRRSIRPASRATWAASGCRAPSRARHRARRRRGAPHRSGGVHTRPAPADAGDRRPGRPRRPAERQRRCNGLLRRATGPAGAGCPIRRSALARHGLSVLRLRRPTRPTPTRSGSTGRRSRTSGSAAASSARFVRRT